MLTAGALEELTAGAELGVGLDDGAGTEELGASTLGTDELISGIAEETKVSLLISSEDVSVGADTVSLSVCDKTADEVLSLLSLVHAQRLNIKTTAKKITALFKKPPLYVIFCKNNYILFTPKSQRATICFYLKNKIINDIF